MKTYLDLIPASAKAHRKQNKMTHICIVLAVSLVAVMFGLADMYLRSMTAEIRHQTGDWHYKISSIDEETAAFIAARPEVELSAWQGSVPAEAGCMAAGQAVSVAGMDKATFPMYNYIL